jgi:uncharacterized protein YndB with AHSA1/START domain
MSQTAKQPVTQNATETPPRKRFSVTKKILMGLVLVLAAFAVVVAMQPSDMRISRSATVDAPPDAVFAQVNDFHNWRAWSPWEKLDPNLQRSYSGAESGEGAVYHWSGNDEVGEGRMTIEESRPNELVHIRLEFVKPFAVTNAAEFTFAPQGEGTAVTWTMTGEKNFIVKGMGLFMDMDSLIGADFEKGLAQLKDVVETN